MAHALPGQHTALLLLLLLLIASTTTQSLLQSTDLFDWMPSRSTACQGTIADCFDSDSEFDLDSESNRRILATSSSYISYGALNRNRVPCSRRGASYYNCRAGAQANPYRRGCSAITRCRS